MREKAVLGCFVFFFPLCFLSSFYSYKDLDSHPTLHMPQNANSICPPLNGQGVNDFPEQITSKGGPEENGGMKLSEVRSRSLALNASGDE